MYNKPQILDMNDDSIMLCFQEAIKNRDFATMKILLPRMFAMENNLHEIYFKTLKNPTNPFSPNEIYSNLIYCQKALVNIPNYDANDVWLLVMLECLRPASSIISSSKNFKAEVQSLDELICDDSERREEDLINCRIVNGKISALNTVYINGNVDLRGKFLQEEKKLAYLKNKMEWQNKFLNIVNIFAWPPLLLTNIKRLYFKQSLRLFRYTGVLYSQRAACSMKSILELEYSEYFKKIIKDGDINKIKQTIEKSPRMISILHYKDLINAAENGHLNVLDLLMELAPDKVQYMIYADDFVAFRNAARNGHLEVLNRLIELAPGKVQYMICADDCGAFRNAAGNGHLNVLGRLMALAPDKVQYMIYADDCGAFRNAAGNGHLAVLDRLIKLAPGKVQYMICADDYGAFRNAAGNGHLNVLNRLIELAAGIAAGIIVQYMIRADDYGAFRNAAGNGHLAVLDRLIKLAPDKVQDMIWADDYGAFRNAAGNGHLNVLERLIGLAPGKVQDMISANDFGAFRNAAGNGHLNVLERLIGLAQDKVWYMIWVDDFGAFRNAAGNGHLNVLERLIGLAPGKVQDMISANDYGAFRNAAGNGHLNVLERLIGLAPDKVQDMISANDFGAFRNAAGNGHLNVLERLIGLAPGKVQDMISANDFGAFRNAAGNGHLNVLNRLIGLAPGKVQDMIAALNFDAFRHAAGNGHLDVLERLIELAPGIIVQDMISANDFGAFRHAAINGHLNVLDRLMELAPDKVQDMIASNRFEAFRFMIYTYKPYVKKLLNLSSNLFAYAEMHVREGAYIVNLFIDEALRELHAEQDLIVSENANRVFDIVNEDKSKQCFYIIRNLIRKLPGNSDLLNEIRFLIDIPSVKALLHQEVTPNAPNELLRLALSNQSIAAVELLLNIPAVRELAEQNDYYRSEMRGDIDLRRLAIDRESSMTALTPGESRRLESAITHYKQIIERTGVSNIMNELRDNLRRLYNSKPATIRKSNNEVITLPFDWLDFQELDLTRDERNMALKEYYKNKTHTAFRYLSKPNNWMSPQASYVNRADKCSTFEEYQSLISMLYLAAKDGDIQPIDGYTIESRVEQFVYELAYIGRAHNWDRVRERAGVEEEYDDLEGDKPSCYSGVKRRLFQAVKGHPLLKFLTLDYIKQELRAFMRKHFQEKITLDNVNGIRVAWKNLCDTGDLSECFKELDVSPEEQEIFIQILQEKYKAQFTEDPAFINHIKNSFKTDNNFKYHIVRFAGEVGFEQLLKDLDANQMKLSP